ncbi:hypothetical protein Ocin01_19891 [Orchesella cincta]|uniref:Uncharacterized protein n=1 Tax=Orchesella cincta TaxID=48709 RepID=A0A1D2M1G3_ORCCI|nr:hypothetical protein Ocin01_19891 [Orchesella cincta]
MFREFPTFGLTKSLPISTRAFSKPRSNTTLSSENVLQRDPPNLNSIIPDPAVISQQIQSSFQSLLQALNNIGNSSDIFSSLRNLTSSIGIGGLRIDDADYILGNVSEALRIANRSALDASNSSGLQGAFRDFKEVVTRLRSSPLLPTQINAERRAYDAHNNNLEGHALTVNNRNANITSGAKQDGLRRMWDQLSTFQAQVDSSIQQTLSNARSNVEGSLSMARQQGTQFMRNQTMGFMTEVRRALKVFTEPFRKFFDDMRGKLPTTVVKA